MGIIIRTLSRFRGLGLAFGGRWRFSFLFNDGIAVVLILASVGSCSTKQPQGEGGKSESPAATTRAEKVRVSLEAELVRRGAKSELRIKGTGWPKEALLVVNIPSNIILSMTSDMRQLGEPLHGSILVRSVVNSNQAVLPFDLDAVLEEMNGPVEASVMILTSLRASLCAHPIPLDLEVRATRQLVAKDFGSEFSLIGRSRRDVPAREYPEIKEIFFKYNNGEYWRFSYSPGQDVIAKTELSLGGR